jgi:hypothetical protein
MRPFILALSAAALAPGFATAEGFSSGYVTGFATETECMDSARAAMIAHFEANGITPDTGEGSYSVYGFDVPPGITQVAVVCSEDNGSVVATVTGYSIVENGTRLETVQAMIDRINGRPVSSNTAPANPTPTNPTPAPAPGDNK